jgi:hypothetical protein
MSQLGTVVVFETEAFAVFDGEADSAAQGLLLLACWFSGFAVLGECAAACAGEPVSDLGADAGWPGGEPVQYFVTTDPVRLARAARTAARRAGGAR